MNRRLTLSLNSDVVDFAHTFSKKYNKSISKIVENYFIELRKQSTPNLPKYLDELYGVFENVNTPNKKELRKIFHEKNFN
ncbi:MAG: DUF6364 family protein [Clostridiales bacterium]|jgi:hypothetical protein|nr:DUF6364 family protein [Clostridiales bacterium]